MQARQKILPKDRFFYKTFGGHLDFYTPIGEKNGPAMMVNAWLLDMSSCSCQFQNIESREGEGERCEKFKQRGEAGSKSFYDDGNMSERCFYARLANFLAKHEDPTIR